MVEKPHCERKQAKIGHGLLESKISDFDVAKHEICLHVVDHRQPVFFHDYNSLAIFQIAVCMYNFPLF